MAFQKDYISPTQTEYTQAYFIVVEVFISYIRGVANIKIFGYKDQSAQQNGASPVLQSSYDLSGQDFINTFINTGDPIVAAETYLMSLPDFQKAQQIPNNQASVTPPSLGVVN